MSVPLLGESVSTLLRIPMSYEDYVALPPYPRNEWVDGVVVMMSAAPDLRHQQAARRLANLLEDALPGLITAEGVAVRLPRNRERVPDVVVIAAEPGGRVITQPPILVAEVLSPSTQREDLLRKAPEYAEGGISQYWVVDPDGRSVEVLRNFNGGWQLVTVIDVAQPVAEVEVGDHGAVRVGHDAVLGD